MKIKKILTIILLIIVLLTIFMFSNQTSKESSGITKFFAVNTIKLIDKVTHKKIEGNLTAEKYVKKHFYYIRKCAHITEYIILSIVILGVISYYRKIDLKIVCISMGICFILAICDEVHQLFISGRTGKVIDVFIDSIGILIGSALYYSAYTSGKKITDNNKKKNTKTKKKKTIKKKGA